MSEELYTPKISVITTSYQHGDFIEDNIVSVINQNYSNYEHIIIDGGSTDHTLGILKKYPSLKWISEKDDGQADAFNKGLSLSKGDIIFWLNSDDYLCPNIFNEIVRYFNVNPKSKIVTGNLIMVDINKNFITKYKPDNLTYDNLLNGGKNATQPSTIIKKEVFDNVGYLNTHFHYAMDKEFWIRMAKSYTIDTFNENVACFRYYEGSKSYSHKIRFIKEWIYIGKIHHRRYLSKTNIIIIKEILKYLLKKILR